MIHLKRIYEPDDKEDGYRIFVDRLWPRGLKKEDAVIDSWLKEIAPSNELRKWFHQDTTARWKDFKKKYTIELSENQALPQLLDLMKEHKTVTLIFAAKDEVHNHALVLKEFLLDLRKQK